jgi:hypothetical protein
MKQNLCFSAPQALPLRGFIVLTAVQTYFVQYYWVGHAQYLLFGRIPAIKNLTKT